MSEPPRPNWFGEMPEPKHPRMPTEVAAEATKLGLRLGTRLQVTKGLADISFYGEQRSDLALVPQCISGKGGWGIANVAQYHEKQLRAGLVDPPDPRTLASSRPTCETGTRAAVMHHKAIRTKDGYTVHDLTYNPKGQIVLKRIRDGLLANPRVAEGARRQANLINERKRHQRELESLPRVQAAG